MMDSKVLIVDDDQSIRKALSLTLGARHRVIAAKDGGEAIALFKKENPDIVLLDVGLPGMDGIEVLKKLCKISSDATVVMATAVEDVKTAVNVIKLGA